MNSGLARVTISAPRRRLDVALPAHLPLAELLPEVLRHAGVGLADAGERHGGWLLRRTDGVALESGRALRAQGVHDGELLHLVPARLHWPAPEYDDVVEVIADGARLRGGLWTPAATRMTSLAAAGVPLVVGLVAVLVAGPGRPAGAPLALGAAVVLLGAGVTVARAYGENMAGAALAGGALPYAFVGGALLVSAADPVGPVPVLRWLAAPGLLAGSALMLPGAVIGAVGVAAGLRAFTAAASVAGLAALAGLAGFVLPGPAVAAGLLAVLVLGIGSVPSLAIRLGRVPLPPVTLPTGTARDLPHRGAVLTAVARTEELLAGLLTGSAVVAGSAATLLVGAGGPAGWVLAGICSAAFLLRARIFVTRWHRVPLLVAGLCGIGLLGVAWAGTAGPGHRLLLAAGGSVVALLVAAAGIGHARRAPSPYLARAGDLAETGLLVSVVPVACAVFGLYGWARGLLG